jgi:TRAP-type C4-dicarboxylate transport system permease small subunit
MKKLNWKKLTELFRSTENILALIILLALAFIPSIEVFLRKFFQNGIEGSNNYTAHLVLLITFIGGMITAREKQHLSIATLLTSLKGNVYINTPFDRASLVYFNQSNASVYLVL